MATHKWQAIQSLTHGEGQQGHFGAPTVGIATALLLTRSTKSLEPAALAIPNGDAFIRALHFS
jgi:hypothetical protein